MSMSRKDSKGRVLRKGESQRKNDGRYIYQYTDSTGKRRVVYSNDLILSILVDTFSSRISLTMPPSPKPHNTACVLS